MYRTDSELWELCLFGDKKAFEELYCRFYSCLYYYGIKISANEEVVKDCIQDLFIKLIQNYKNLSTTSSVKSYLIKALRNKIYDYYEQEREVCGVAECEFHFSDEDLADKKLLVDEEMANLYKNYNQLPSNYREVVYLYFVIDLSHKEIGELLGINQQSSKNLLFRAISKLKQIYKTNRE